MLQMKGCSSFNYLVPLLTTLTICIPAAMFYFMISNEKSCSVIIVESDQKELMVSLCRKK